MLNEERSQLLTSATKVLFATNLGNDEKRLHNCIAGAVHVPLKDSHRFIIYNRTLKTIIAGILVISYYDSIIIMCFLPVRQGSE